MNQLFLVRILQGTGHLCDVGDDGVERELGTFRLALAQVAARSIVHDQEGSHSLHTKVQDLDNEGMP